MKKVAATLVLAVFAVSSAFGGTVSFDPAETTVGPGDPTRIDMDVTLSSLDTIAGTNAFNIVMGSEDIAMVGFAMDGAFQGAYPLSSVLNPSSPQVYPNNITLGAFGFVANPAPIFTGVLTVDVAGLPVGDYEIIVSADRDNNQSGAQDAAQTFEPLFGSATIHVVPEPATLVLLGLGGIVAVSRRRKAL